MIKKGYLLLILLCLIIACGIFLWRNATSVESELSVPIAYANLPVDLIIVGQPPKEVEVTVHGQKSVVGTFLKQKHSCLFDLAGAKAGLVTLPVGESNLQFSEGVSIDHIEPTSITLRIEPKLTKTVPVVVALSDNPAMGYRVALTLSTPSSLQIIGPEKNLSQIDQLTTLPISIKDVSESFKREVAVDLPNGAAIRGDGTPLVTVQVNIEENVIVRRFENILVEGREAVFPAKITPPIINLDISGPENALSSLSVEDDIKVYVHLKGLSPGVYIRRAQITLPVGTTLVEANPEIFSVKIGP